MSMPMGWTPFRALRGPPMTTLAFSRSGVLARIFTVMAPSSRSQS